MSDPIPILSLPPKWSANQQKKVALGNVKLGDGYNLLMPIGIDPLDESWEIESPALNSEVMLAHKLFFEQLAGVDRFEWSPFDDAPRNAYVCSSWRVNPVGVGYYRLSATFETLRVPPPPPPPDNGGQ